MVRALSTDDRRSQTLRAIAEMLWIEPNSSIASLAKAASLSRRTLYRIAATRADLIYLLHEEAVLSTRKAMDHADIVSGPWREALHALVESFVKEGPVYAFWITGSDSNPGFADELRHYRSMMINFFERGQAEGVLITTRSAAWMLDAFDGLLLASLAARRNGSAEIESLPMLVMDAFTKAFESGQSE